MSMAEKLTKEEKLYLDDRKPLVDKIMQKIPAVKSKRVDNGDGTYRVTVTSEKFPMVRRTKKIYQIIKFMEQYGLNTEEVNYMSKAEARRRSRRRNYYPAIHVYNGNYEDYKSMFGCIKNDCEECKSRIICETKNKGG